MSEPADGERAEMWRAIRARFPGLREALVADARVTARYRGERHEFRGALDTVAQIVRLAIVSDAYLGQALYRGKARAAGARGAACCRGSPTGWRWSSPRSRSATR